MATQSKPEQTATESFFLSPMLSVEITVTATSMLCRWEPMQQPSLTDAELERFQAARTLMLERQAAMRAATERE